MVADASVDTHKQHYGAPGRTREEGRKIRAWARAHGVTVNDRGRLPLHVIEAYENREDEDE